MLMLLARQWSWTNLESHQRVNIAKPLREVFLQATNLDIQHRKSVTD